MLEATANAWRRWMAACDYAGPEASLVRRSAITLKMCDDWTNGSLVAAPTSSLPAPVGGVRNWDYRYAWIRDAAFTVFAMRRIGFRGEADAASVVDAVYPWSSVAETSNGDNTTTSSSSAPVLGAAEAGAVCWAIEEPATNSSAGTKALVILYVRVSILVCMVGEQKAKR